MLEAGQTAFNHRTNSFWEILDTGAKENGSGFKVRITCEALAPPDTRLHVHTNCNETFEILEGRAHYRLGTKEAVAEAGETLQFPKGTPHVHPWAAGGDRMIYTHSGEFDDRNPGNFQDIWGATFTTFGLSKTPSQLRWDGIPYSVLQGAAIARTFGLHGAYDCALPVWAGRIANATLGTFANLMGFQGVIPAQIERAEHL